MTHEYLILLAGVSSSKIPSGYCKEDRSDVAHVLNLFHGEVEFSVFRQQFEVEFTKKSILISPKSVIGNPLTPSCMKFRLMATILPIWRDRARKTALEYLSRLREFQLHQS